MFIRSWRNNIRSKVSAPNQLEIYQTLCILERELDEATFTTLSKSFIERWEKEDPKFVTYFQEHYCNRTGRSSYVRINVHTCHVLKSCINNLINIFILFKV